MTAFNKKPSPTYLQALSAMHKLMEEEGGDFVRRACADVTWEDNKRIFAKREGLKEAKTSSIERLTGKRSEKEIVRLFKESSQSLEDYSRLSEKPVLPKDDHSSLWLKDGKPYAYVSQPYQLSLNDVKKLASFCDEYNLDMLIEAYPSWHFPGEVLTVKVTKQKVKNQND